MASSTPALAVIDGTLRHLSREGAPGRVLVPLATAVLEFRRGPMCVYVREHPHGLLPGIPNLYCVDGALRLQWMAEWPDEAGACARIVNVRGDILTAESDTGAVVHLEAHSGRLLVVEMARAAATA